MHDAGTMGLVERVGDLDPVAEGLVEREGALAVLEQAHAHAAEAGAIALVSGEAGIGKTSLVMAFIESLDERAFVAVGRCDALFTPRVLGPVHDIAARLGGDLAARLESGAARAAAFTSFLEALKRLGNPVIVFEDLHWADEATLDLVKYLQSLNRTYPVLPAAPKPVAKADHAE